MDDARAATIPAVGAAWHRTWHQLSGRGRRGATWRDVPGCAFLGTLVIARGGAWDPRDENPGTLALRVAASLYRAASRLTLDATDDDATDDVATDDDATERAALAIKWPNDLLVNGRKASGILIEADRSRFLVGIGVNLSATTWPDSASLLAPAPVAPVERFAVLLESSLREMLVPDARWHEVVLSVLAWRNRDVVVSEEGGAPVRGRLETIDRDGALVLTESAAATGGEAGVRRRVLAGRLRLSDPPTTDE